MDNLSKFIAYPSARERHRTYSLRLGPMDNLAHVIADRSSKRAALVDPGWDAGAILSLLAEEGLLLTDVLVTHGHDDHVNALAALLEYAADTDNPATAGRAPAVHVMAEEADFWRYATASGTAATIPEDRATEVWRASPPRRLVRHEDGDRIPLGASTIECLATPGHSPGGACYRVGGHLFTGDTLFVYGCGRCDLPGGDPERMFHSLARLKTEIPEATTIFPGHRYAPESTSTMGEQRRANPFLHFDDAPAFIDFRAEHNRHRHPPYRPVPYGTRPW